MIKHKRRIKGEGWERKTKKITIIKLDQTKVDEGEKCFRGIKKWRKLEIHEKKLINGNK